MYPVKGKKKKKKPYNKEHSSTGVCHLPFTIFHSSEWLWMWKAELSSSGMSLPPFFFFWKTSSLGNLNNAPFFPCGRLDILYWVESRIPLIVTGPWRGGNAGVCSLCVPLVFLTSIDPPAFRPRRCMNRMKAALEEPVTDIMSPQTFIKMPFILLLGPLTAHTVPGAEWSSASETYAVTQAGNEMHQ